MGLFKKEIGTSLIADAPIPAVVDAVSHAVLTKPGWKDRKLKYVLLQGIGEYWKIDHLDPDSPERMDGEAPAPMYDLIRGIGETVIHVAYRSDSGQTEARFFGFAPEADDPPVVGRMFAKTVAKRTGDFLAEAGIRFNIEAVKG